LIIGNSKSFHLGAQSTSKDQKNVSTDANSMHWIALFELSAQEQAGVYEDSEDIEWGRQVLSQFKKLLGRSGPNLEFGTMRVYETNSPRNGLHIGRKVGPCPGSRRRRVLGSVHAKPETAGVE